MSWVTVIWSMVASACLTLAAMHVVIWANRRTTWASLLFAVTAAATAAVTGFELWLMRAETAGEYGVALRWAHVPYWVLIISLVGFVRLYLRAGRPWLAYAICGARTLSLILDFAFSPNLNYREITGLRHVRFLGETVSVAVGIPNPWMLVGQASFLLLTVYVLDVMRTVSRRGDRRQARVLTIAIVFFVLAATGQIVLVMWQIVHTLLTPSLFFLGIVAAMAYEMSADVRRAAQLSDDLRESEERMTLATEAGGVGIWLWSIASNQVWGSERWLHLFGFPPDTAVSFENIIQHVHPDDRGAVEREVRRALEDRGDYAGEYRVVLPDGTERWLASRGRTYLDAHGKPVRMVGAAIDITERTRTDLELQQQRNELAHVTRVSTMGEMAASVTHELGQPLGAILRNAEAAELFLLAPSPDLEEVRAILADIRKDDQRAGAVIDRMRSMLKRRQLAHSLLDVNHLAGEVIALARPEADGRKLRLVLDPVSSCPPVRGDRVQLQQVLLNLLLNAMDAMTAFAPDGGRVTVRVQAAGAQVEVAVSDTGPGVSADALAHVFTPFFTTKPNGLGMGLAISRSIVQAHGGRLWARNNEAGGATFAFTLPAAEGGAPRD
jgi:two-component system, LuxR family, sensor kinase FixL